MILARIEWVGTIDVRKARSARLLEHHPQFLDGLVVSADTWQSKCIVKSVVPVLGNVAFIRCAESPPVFVNPLSGRGHVTARRGQRFENPADGRGLLAVASGPGEPRLQICNRAHFRALLVHQLL
jgi:hypothetical protein